MFKFKITPDRHNGRQKLNNCVLPHPLIFRYHLPLKGHGNEADFLGFLHKPVRHRLPRKSASLPCPFKYPKFPPIKKNYSTPALSTVHYQRYRNECINISISKLIIGTKPKRFDLFQNCLKSNRNVLAIF
jgi:hypothetical protein